MSELKEIEFSILEDALYNKFKQYKQKWVINQDTGKEIELKGNVLNYISKLHKPKIVTDDDGILELITVQVFWDMKNNDVYTGKILYILFKRK